MLVANYLFIIQFNLVLIEIKRTAKMVHINFFFIIQFDVIHVSDMMATSNYLFLNSIHFEIM